MNRIVVHGWRVGLAALLLLQALPGTAGAQGISAILSRLDRLEGQVAQLDRVRPGAASALAAAVASEADLAAVADRLARLEDRLEKLATERAQAGTGEVASLEGAVASLVADVNRLAALYDEQSRERAVATEAPEAPEVPAPDDARITAPAGVEISGFVDASHFYDRESPVGGTFGLDQMEVNLRRTIGSVGFVRADVEWVNDGAGGFALDVEQGFLQFNLPGQSGATVSFGKFNAPIGFELLDPTDMFQFSHALVFSYGLPTNLTGAMVADAVSVRVSPIRPSMTSTIWFSAVAGSTPRWTRSSSPCGKHSPRWSVWRTRT